jgi:integrase
VPGVLVRFGTKQRRRFACRPEAVETLKELGALIGTSGVAANVGAQILTRFSDGSFTEAKARAAIKVAAKEGAHRTGQELTFAELGKQWTEGKIADAHPDHVKRKATADKDAERLAVLNKTIGKVSIASFRLADAELAMRALPRDLSSATRRQYAQCIGRLLALAVYPLKLRAASPLPRGFLPKVTRTKATAWLYPADDAQLLACEHVPLARRVLYGFLAREGCRCDEALSLAWTDLDLARGVVRLDENKTNDPRAWALSPGVAAALERWREERSADGLVFAVPNEARLAEVFRADLAAAGVARPELFARTKARQPIRAHDLRATFVTLSLANGKTETWVMDRTGHRSSVMINTYRRAARTAAELGLGELAPLDRALAWAEAPSSNAGRYSASNPPPRKRAV